MTKRGTGDASSPSRDPAGIGHSVGRWRSRRKADALATSKDLGKVVRRRVWKSSVIRQGSQSMTGWQSQDPGHSHESPCENLSRASVTRRESIDTLVQGV